MEILTKENLLSGGKNCSHCSFQDFDSLTKGNQASLVRMHFSHPESDGKSADVGSGGRIGILKNKSSYPEWNYSPFFSAKGVVKLGVKLWWNIPRATFSKVWVSEAEISPKFRAKNGVKNGKSSVFCENLRFSAPSEPSKCLNFQEKGWIRKNLRFSCENLRLGSLCHLSSVPLRAPREKGFLFQRLLTWTGSLFHKCRLSDNRGSERRSKKKRLKSPETLAELRVLWLRWC